LSTPIAAFNGGMFVKSDLSVIEQRVLQADVIEPAMETMRKHGLDTGFTEAPIGSYTNVMARTSIAKSGR
jgi:hypothetical protein